MDFPARQRVVYQSNPLVEVVCQLRFHQLFAIDETVPAGFQRDLGDGFPKASTRLTKSISIGPGSEAAGISAPRVLYDFVTEDDAYRITLSSDFLAVSSSNYHRWETFEAHLHNAIGALTRNYPVKRFTRVGLRYVNVLDRKKMDLEAPWAELLRPSTLGLVADNDVPIADLFEHNSTTLFRLNAGKLALRQGLKIENGQPDGSYIIDSDLFSEDGIEANGDLNNLLRQYNETARNAFRWLISERLHEALGPSEPDA